MTTQLSPVEAQKKRAAEYAVAQIDNGMKVGLGTGSTARFAVAALGERVRREGLSIKAVPTSEATRQQAEEEGIPLVSFDAVERLDLCFDGADEADPKLNLTKGGGGALLREKVVAFTSAKFYCIVDEAKLVEKLHAFPLPVEVVPFAAKVVERELRALGGEPSLRQKNGQPYVTDNGLWILDCRFPPIEDPPLLAQALSSIPGIAEHGLFCGMVHELVVGTNDGVRILKGCASTPSSCALATMTAEPDMRALLGPTNTGKTHLALQELLAHDDGVIGFPLRLLAREAYDRLCARVGADKVALVTGEEKLVPRGARYFACTVEAMPEHLPDDRPFSFVAVDEIQLCADRERGHVFTDRLLRRRGTHTTLVLGQDTIAPVLTRLLPGVEIESRPRLSSLSFTGERKISRLPRRSAVVAFSVVDVYRIAEEVRHHHGGAAVVTGALSPATRNAQVGLFESGEVDVLVATDAIGMGLNLDIDHVAFAAVRKFDGEETRELVEPELAQIAGRAGRHLKDGTFGTTRGVPPFADDVVERIERSRFPPLSALCWRNPDLDMTSLAALHASLRSPPPSPSLTFGRPASDLLALERLMHDPDVRATVHGPQAVRSFFEHCQIPDFEKTGPLEHASIIREVWMMTSRRSGFVDEDWLARRVRDVDDISGDVETLIARVSRVRTLTYLAHKADWVRDAAHWQGVTRGVEDRLSDALHERLTVRFVDRLARVVVGGGAVADVASDGAVQVAGETIGRIDGLRFIPGASGTRGRIQEAAAQQGLLAALQARVDELLAAPPERFDVDPATLVVRFDGADVGRLVPGRARLWPRAALPQPRGRRDLLDEGAVRRRLDDKLTAVARAFVARALPHVVALANDEDLPTSAIAIRHALLHGLGVAPRAPIERSAGPPDVAARRALRRHHVRLGFIDVWTDEAFKEKGLRCRAALLALAHAADRNDVVVTVPDLPPPGASSFPLGNRPRGFVAGLGFHVLDTLEGPRAFRADLIDDVAAALAAFPPGFSSPASACERLGCSREALAAVLRFLGYHTDDTSEPRRWRRGRRSRRR